MIYRSFSIFNNLFIDKAYSTKKVCKTNEFNMFTLFWSYIKKL